MRPWVPAISNPVPHEVNGIEVDGIIDLTEATPAFEPALLVSRKGRAVFGRCEVASSKREAGNIVSLMPISWFFVQVLTNGWGECEP